MREPDRSEVPGMTPSSGDRNVATFDAGTVDPGHVERRVIRATGFVPVEAKMHPPLLRDDLVTRSDLLTRLTASAGSTVVLVSAPPGYGKTSMIRQWVDGDPRPFAWLTLDAGDDDAATLVTYLMLVLQRIEPVDLDVLAPLTGGDAAISAVVLPRLGRMLRRRSQPFVLVLDEADAVTGPDALGTLSVIVDNLPKGSQLVVIARAAPDLPWHRLRAERRVTDVGVDDLRLTVDESRELVEMAGRDASSSDLVALVDRTEGWATGLYLALLSTSSQQPVSHEAVPVAGDNVLVAAYLRDELLARLPADQQSFLLHVSILDRMSGPLCDAVLATTGSGPMLRRLGDANLFVVPLD